MAKIVRKIPVYVLEARRRDSFLDKQQKAFLAKRYPSCIGTFPECEDLKPGELIPDCLKCPLFDKVSFEAKYNKKPQEVKQVAKKDKKNTSKEKKSGNREERIKELLEKEKTGQIKPQERAWITIYKKKGFIQIGAA